MQPIARVEHPLLDQIQAYQDMKKELERDYFGRWIIIHQGLVQGDYDSFDNAEEARREMDIKINECLVKHVGSNPVIIIYGGTPPHEG